MEGHMKQNAIIFFSMVYNRNIVHSLFDVYNFVDDAHILTPPHKLCCFPLKTFQMKFLINAFERAFPENEVKSHQ